MSLEARILLFGVVVPGLVAVASVLTVWRRARSRGTLDRDDRDGPVWLVPPLLLLGFSLADWVIQGVPSLWPDSAAARYTHAVALVALLGLTEGLIRLPIWTALTARMLVYAGVVWILVEPYREVGTVPDALFFGWMAVAALGGGAVATACDRAAKDLRGGLTAIILLPVVVATAAIAFEGTLAYASQTLGSTVAVLASVLVAGLVVRGIRLDRGGVTTVLGILLAMFLGVGLHAGGLHAPPLVLLGIAPLGLVAAWWLRDRHWLWRHGAGLLATLTVLGAAVGVTLLETRSLADDQSESQNDDTDDWYPYPP